MPPLRLQRETVPRCRPAYRKRMSPFWQGVAAGAAEIAGAVVIAGAGVRLDVQRGGVRAYEVEIDRAERPGLQCVVHRQIDAARLLVSEIQRRVVHVTSERE